MTTVDDAARNILRIQSDLEDKLLLATRPAMSVTSDAMWVAAAKVAAAAPHLTPAQRDQLRMIFKGGTGAY